MHGVRITILTSSLAAAFLALAACTGGESPLAGTDPEPAARAESTVENVSGRWQLTNISGKPPLADADAWLEIDLAAGQLSGSTGCNGFVVSFEGAPEALSMRPMVTTKKMCADALIQQEQRILNVLTAVNAMAIAADGALELRGAKGQLQATRAVTP